MNSPPRQPSAFDGEGLLPDAAACVWMTAGLVAFKLCDRDFDCDECPFDAAMGASPAVGVNAACDSSTWRFSNDRRYHPCHSWVLDVGAHRVRVGLDAFAASLVGHGTSFILPAAGSRVRQGRVGFWVKDGAFVMPGCAPISGMVKARNPRLQQHPELLLASPYDEGWLFELSCDDGKAERGVLIGAEAMRCRSEQQLQELRELAATHLSRGLEEVGTTLADGGEPVDALRGLLGADRFRRLMLPFLSSGR